MRNAYIIYRKELFVKLMLYIILITSLLIWSIYYFKVQIVIDALALLIFLPLILLKLVMKYFTRKIQVDVNNERISVDVEKLNGSKSIAKNIYLNQVGSYQISYPNRRFVDSIFNMKSGKKISLSFAVLKNENQGIKTDEITDSFRQAIVNYNTSTTPENKILLKPSFYASTGGLVSIFILLLLIVTDIILHIIYSNYSIKSLPITLFLGVMILIQVIIRRTTDLKRYNEMKW